MLLILTSPSSPGCRAWIAMKSNTYLLPVGARRIVHHCLLRLPDRDTEAMVAAELHAIAQPPRAGHGCRRRVLRADCRPDRGRARLNNNTGTTQSKGLDCVFSIFCR